MFPCWKVYVITDGYGVYMRLNRKTLQTRCVENVREATFFNTREGAQNMMYNLVTSYGDIQSNWRVMMIVDLSQHSDSVIPTLRRRRLHG